jgi:hypothetical protein
MEQRGARKRFTADLHHLAAVATLITSAVMLVAWVETWPAAAVLTGLGLLGIVGVSFVLWRVAFAPVIAWQEGLLANGHRRFAFRLVLLYPVLLFPVAMSFAMGYWIESELTGLVAFMCAGLLLVAFMLIRAGGDLLSQDDRRTLSRGGWWLREAVPRTGRVVLGFTIATFFVYPWSARGGGVLVSLWLVGALGYWVAERYWNVTRPWPLVLPPWRMLGMTLSPIPMCPADGGSEPDD